MANELLLNATIQYEDSTSQEISAQVSDKQVTMTTVVAASLVQSIATSETTIDLGSVASLGWVMFINLDPTNFIQIKTGASGTIIAKLFPGEFFFCRLGSGITAPVAIADTAACRMRTLICSA